MLPQTKFTLHSHTAWHCVDWSLSQSRCLDCLDCLGVKINQVSIAHDQSCKHDFILIFFSLSLLCSLFPLMFPSCFSRICRWRLSSLPLVPSRNHPFLQSFEIVSCTEDLELAIKVYLESSTLWSHPRSWIACSTRTNTLKRQSNTFLQLWGKKFLHKKWEIKVYHSRALDRFAWPTPAGVGETPNH